MRRARTAGRLLPAALLGCLSIASAADAAAVEASDAAEVVVRRGTAELTFGEIDERLAEVPADRRAAVMDSPERIDTLLQQLLMVEQLADEAIAAGLDSGPGAKQRLDLARKRQLAQLRLQQLRDEAPVGFDAGALAQERYLADRAAFALPETRTVRHILVSTADRSDEQARARAVELAARHAAGESFEALAREASDDAATRAAGGLIEGLPAGVTDSRFDTAKLALVAPGDVTPEPVRTERGWHLIELVSVNPPRQRSFDEVREELVASVVAAELERRLRSHTDGLQNLPIEADPDRVASLRTRYADAGSAADGPKTAANDEP